jgi:tetratricopeptide (TPR) repeat protein
MLKGLLDRLTRRADALATRANEIDPLIDVEQRLDEVDVAGARLALEKVGDKPTSDSRIDIFRGRLAMMEQRYEDAERLLSEVLLYAPSSAEGNAWMAAVKMCQKEPEEAVRLAERAYRLGYHRAWLLEMSGTAHFAADRFEQAAAAWTAALALEPDRLQSRTNLIEVLAKLHRWSEMEGHLTLALEQKGESAKHLAYLGESLLALNREEEAWPIFERASARPDADALVFHRQGAALFNAGRLSEARRALDRAAVLDPPDEVFLLLSNIDLIERGSNRRNWEAYENRLRLPSLKDGYRVRTRRWSGERLRTDEALLIYCEQGIGDILLFSRFLPDIARLAGCRVHFGVRAELERLIRQTASLVSDWGNISVSGSPRPEELTYVAELPLMSLLSIVDLPVEKSSGGYLLIGDELDRQWAERLRPSQRKRVGIVWAGNPNRFDDAIRSIPTLQLADLQDDELLRRVEFVNLQMDGRREHMASPLPLPHADPRPEITDFADTAAIMKQLDLVISIDTAAAHLAGALGVPCWLLLSRLEDWRWSMNGVDQPWYGSIRSFRVDRNREWTDVLRRVKQELLEWSRTA